MGHNSCGLTRAEWRNRIASLNLQATQMLMWPNLPLALFACCWFMFKLVFSKTSWSFSVKLLSSWSVPSMQCYMESSLPSLWGFALLFAELHEALVRYFFQSFKVPLDAILWCVSHSSQFCYGQTHLEHAFIIQIIYEDVKQDSRSFDPYVHN